MLAAAVVYHGGMIENVDQILHCAAYGKEKTRDAMMQQK